VPHTAGPWSVSLPLTGQDVTIEARTPIHGNPVFIARVYGPGVLSKAVETRDANARLLSSAWTPPPLVEAARESVRRLQVLVDSGEVRPHASGSILEVVESLAPFLLAAEKALAGGA
jgi:hypothetical protein